MIVYAKGDIFDAPTDVLVNPVNTVGVMGKGLAKQYKEQFPHMFACYNKACRSGSFKIGTLMLVTEAEHRVLLFPTKEHWRNPSTIGYLEAGLEKLIRTYASKGITSIAFPMLGTGCGGLPKDQVLALMEKYLAPLPITVYIYK